jgi:hypothetical protein
MAIDRLASFSELLPELAGWRGETALHEWESEGHLESEAEAEQFFGQLARLASNAISSPSLRNLALTAARSALGGLPSSDREIPTLHHELSHEAETEVSPLGRVYPDVAGGGGLSPIARVYPEALMEHLGHAAAEAESLHEADAFLGALVPLATSLVPKIAPALTRAAPALIKGVTRVGRTLLRSPTTRHLIRTVPGIVRGTAVNLLRRASHGQPINPQAAVRALAGQAARVLSSPSAAVRTYRRSQALNRHYRALAGRRAPALGWTPGYAPAPSYYPRGGRRVAYPSWGAGAIPGRYYPGRRAPVSYTGVGPTPVSRCRGCGCVRSCRCSCSACC